MLGRDEEFIQISIRKPEGKSPLGESDRNGRIV
jgi:hypothetical protein